MRRKPVPRAIAILKEFGVDDPELGVTELSTRLGMTKSSVFHSLKQLKEGGFVDQDSVSAKYRLGRGVATLVQGLAYSDPLLRIAEPFMVYVAQRLGEATYLAVRQGDQALILWRVLSPALREQVRWMGSKPLHSTACGKVLLAGSNDHDLEALLERGLPQYTDNTITDSATLREELSKVRERGFAVSFEEQESGVNALAVPVTGLVGQTLAALGVVGRSYSLTREKSISSVESLQAVSTEIARQL